MSTAGNARFNATITEPITEASVREWAIPIVHEKCEVTACRGVYDPPQCWQDRQIGNMSRLGFRLRPLY